MALNITGSYAFAVGQQNEEAAKGAAVEQCQKKADDIQSPRKCELYAVGNTIVYPHGKPPLPPQPWIRHDPSIEKPFAAREMPLVRDAGKARLESYYAPGRKTKSIAMGPGGQFFYNIGVEAIEDSARRNLESCGAVTGVACMIVAIDDAFVVPVPSTLKVTGFFQAAISSSIAAHARDDVSRNSRTHRADGVRSLSARPGARVFRSRRPANGTRSTKPWAIASSATAIATSSRSARFRLDRISA